MKKLSDLFEVSYGNKFDLNKMTSAPRSDTDAVNFVSRTSKNNGVSARVRTVAGVAPYAPGLITVALGGTKLLSSFVQPEPFYTAQNVAVLRPKAELTLRQKIYYCICIKRNDHRYSAFGREANRTLRDILVPDLDAVPDWVGLEEQAEEYSAYQAPCSPTPVELPPVTEWKPFSYSALFEIRKGQRITKRQMEKGSTPCVRPTAYNNGVVGYIAAEPNHVGNTISVSYNGSVGEAFYQPVPYFALDDINVMYPLFDLTPHIALFLCALIRREQYRYNYGRKWHLNRMEESIMRLPVDPTGNPDWALIDKYMKSLPYSASVTAAE